MVGQRTPVHSDLCVPAPFPGGLDIIQLCVSFLLHVFKIKIVCKDNAKPLYLFHRRMIMNEKAHIAACGINCRTCYVYQRAVKPCGGCNGGGYQPAHCVSCAIRVCGHSHGRCDTCSRNTFCVRLKRMDKRYREKYRLSLIANLERLREEGETTFMEAEYRKWTCPFCGGYLCVHQAECLHCRGVNPHFPGQGGGQASG